MKIAVIGGGFAGLSALTRLCGWKRAEVVLFDRKETFDFLPCVPDIIGRGIRPETLTVGLRSACEGMGCAFVNEEVLRVDCARKKVVTQAGETAYDYLLVSSGAQTNFFGNEDARRYGYTLYTVEDGNKLMSSLKTVTAATYVIAGGGYTGVEAATTLRRYFDGRGLQKRITLVELSPEILGSLPLWMRRYAQANLARMKVEVKTRTTVAQAQAGRIRLSDGETLEDSQLVWSAGLRTADFIGGLDVKKGSQGRILVDNYLGFAPQAFAAGDAALYMDKGVPLRMAVQFSIVQGRLAARNIINAACGRRLFPYRPVDLGYIIPMANNRSCGLLFSSVKVKGLFATMLHFLMCIYRTPGLGRKAALVRDLLC